MILRVRLFILILSLFAVTACNRAKPKTSSTISIRAPGDPAFLGKSDTQSLATIPAGRKVCYGVTVTGPGITTNPPSTCNPNTGLIAGFVEANGLLELNVPRGTGRQIDLYLYLMNSGDNGPCPKMNAAFSANELLQTYRIGSALNISLVNDVETVAIAADFPGVSSNLAQQLSLPASCTAGAVLPPNRAGFHISTSMQTATGGGFKLLGRVGSAYDGNVLSNANYKLKIK